MAPLSCPPTSRLLAPTAMSGTPFPSRSPAASTAEPNWSPGARFGPFSVVRCIFTASPTEPVGSMNSMVTEPACCSSTEPTARSSVPSPLMSPTLATEEPNRGPDPTPGMCTLEFFMLVVSLMLPSEFMKDTCTAPVPLSLVPMAMSSVPSPSRSPIPAIVASRPLLLRSPGELETPLPIVALSLTVPLGCMNMMWAFFAWEGPPDRSYIAAMSGTPSSSRSPMPATADPKSA